MSLGDRRVATDSAHTRLPVWDRSPDDVVGILHTREVLTRIAENTVSGAPLDLPSLRPLLRPAGHPWSPAG